MTVKGLYNPRNTSILILLCYSLFINAAQATTATLTESTAYASQRPCAKSCFYWGSSTQGGAGFLAEGIGCAVDPFENECICRSDLQQTADSFLHKCGANAIDISSAIRIYDDYCTSNGWRSP
ncbi:protein bem46 [Aspergillus udagawae]|uniref:Protein bem46 n=1 Tax=Aspergillus udagawae TaxID=91492 RepID=A0ABQ1B3B6_9EURO|nr:protein bem46 [Aspergillus udagawae]GFG24092.1 protein bem46 [Aspergillus udagawae]